MAKIRMSRKLRESVDVAIAASPSPPSDRCKLLMDILLEFEAAGHAMRRKGRSGKIVWKATPELRRRIAEEERAMLVELQECP